MVIVCLMISLSELFLDIVVLYSHVVRVVLNNQLPEGPDEI